MALFVKTGSFTRPAAGTTNTTVSTVGFTPTAVIFFMSNVITAGTWRAKMEEAIGFAAKVPGDQTTIGAASASIASNDASASPSARNAVQGVLRLTDGAGAVQAEALSFTFNSSGFVIDWANSPYDAEQEQVGWLALGGDARAVAALISPSPSQFLASSFDLPIDARFQPSAAIILTATDNALSVGVVAGSGQWALSLADQQGANPTNQYRRMDNVRAVSILRTTDGVVRYGASVSQMRSNGITLSRAAWNLWAVIATYGSLGSGTAPNFNTPGQVAITSTGKIYVVDTANNRLVRLNSNGTYDTAITGLTGITGVCVDSSDNVYVTHPSGVSTTIKKYNSSHVQQWSNDVLGVAYRHVATDNINLYYTDPTNSKIWKHLCSGGSLPTSWGSAGSGNGQFSTPWGICVTGGEVYVVDSGNNRVQVFDTIGTYKRQWAIPAGCRGISPDGAGGIFVACNSGNTFLQYTNTGTLILSFPQATPDGIAVAPGNIIWVSNAGSHNVAKWGEVPPTATIAVLYLTGLTANCGVSAKPISGAPATHTIATGMNNKAAIFASHQDTTLATNQDHLRLSVGASDGTTHVNITGHAQDAVSTSNSDSRFDNAFALVKANNTANTDEAKATVSFTTGNLILTWNPNDAIATQIAWLALGNETKLEAVMSAQSGFFPTKPGNPTPLSGLIEAVSTIPYAVIGNIGNMGSVAFDGLSTAEPKGFGFSHALGSTIAAQSTLIPAGVRLSTALAAAMNAVSDLDITQKLGRGSQLVALIEALSTLSSGGVKLDQNLGARIVAVSDLQPRFKIAIPAVPDAGPTDIPGTLNWHINPSAERELTGWFSYGSGPTIDRTTEEAWDGVWSVVRETDAGSAGQGIMARGVSGLFLTGLDKNGNERRIFGQTHILADMASDGVELETWLRVRYEDATTAEGEHVSFTLDRPTGTADDWLRIVAPALVLNPAKVLNYAEIIVATPVPLAAKWYQDGVQIEEDRGAGATPFTIGSYGRSTGYWTGVPHVSMSQRDPIGRIINGAGRGGDVVIRSRLLRMTWDNIPVEDISDAVISGKVTMNTERKVTWSFDCNLTWEGWKKLTPNFDWVAPFMDIYWPDGTVESGQLGLYFVVPSEAERGEFGGTVKLSCFDPLWLIERQAFIGPVVVRDHEDKLDAVNKLLDGAVLTGGDDTGVAKRYVVPRAGKNWKKGREWPRDTNRLKLINEILEGAGCYPLWTTAQGVITTRKMGPDRLHMRTPVKGYAAHLPLGYQSNIWIPRVTRPVSEVVGAINTRPKAMDFFDSILMVNDDPDSKGIFVRGELRGPHRDKDDEKKKHDHDRDRERDERRDQHHNRDRDRNGRDRQEDSRQRDRDRRRGHDDDQRRNDQERNRNRDENERRRDREREREDRRKDRERANELGGQDRVVFKGKNRTRIRKLIAPYVDDEDTAAEIAIALMDDLSCQTRHATIRVLPAPHINYCRETIQCAIWDALGEPVLTGQYVVRSITWGFRPNDCIQVMNVDFVDPADSGTELALV